MRTAVVLVVLVVLAAAAAVAHGHVDLTGNKTAVLAQLSEETNSGTKLSDATARSRVTSAGIAVVSSGGCSDRNVRLVCCLLFLFLLLLLLLLFLFLLLLLLLLLLSLLLLLLLL